MAPVELDIWGEPALKLGEKVRMRNGDGTIAIIDRFGIHPKVFRVEPALSGSNWHVEQELERV